MAKDLRFCGPYDHPQYEGEMNDGTTITEQTYVPIAEQILEMIRAGQFLEEYRRARWDFGPGEEVDESVDPDPTVHADPAEVYLMQARLLGRRDQALALAEKARLEELARNVPTEEEVEKIKENKVVDKE